MILQKLLSNKNCKKYCLSLAVVFAIALAVVGRATFGGVVSEYNMPYSEWTTSMFFLQGAMVTVYSIVFTALFAIPLGFIFLGADRQDLASTGEPRFALSYRLINSVKH
ncbi:DUF2534 family protein [Klebsiella pneumoniae]